MTTPAAYERLTRQTIRNGTAAPGTIVAAQARSSTGSTHAAANTTGPDHRFAFSQRLANDGATASAGSNDPWVT